MECSAADLGENAGMACCPLVVCLTHQSVAVEESPWTCVACVLTKNVRVVSYTLIDTQQLNSLSSQAEPFESVKVLCNGFYTLVFMGTMTD